MGRHNLPIKEKGSDRRPHPPIYSLPIYSNLPTNMKFLRKLWTRLFKKPYSDLDDMFI